MVQVVQDDNSPDFPGVIVRQDHGAKPEPEHRGFLRGLMEPSTWGLVVGALMFALSLTPSLLTRDWLFQGVAAGLSAATGHLVGVVLQWVWVLWIRDLVEPLITVVTRGRTIPPRWRPRLRVALIAVIVVALLVWILFAVQWQQQIADIMGDEAYSAGEFLKVLPVGLLLWVGFYLVGKIVVRGTVLLARAVPGQHTRYGLKLLVSWAVVGVVTVFVADQILPGTILRVSERIFSVRDQEIREDLVEPTVPERSGGPGSLNEWEDLGAYGTRFTALGLYKDQLEELTGRPAEEPIRVYAGLSNGDTDRARALNVVDELERTNAQDREALMVAPTTGTGWVNPTAAQAFELMFDGNTAIAADQYSYLPSALQFITDRNRVREAGKELIDAVADWWERLPADNRPKLYVYGESLGTTAGEGGFSGVRDIASTVDGVLWLGPPNSNELWRDFVTRRDPGTREVDPEYSGGMMVRFAENSEQIQRWINDPEDGGTSWDGSRVLYVQHPSDPVVWWSPNLLFREPDWLKEPPGFDRSPTMQWMPIVTFWQVTLDLPRAGNVPNGHGHNYGTSVLDGLVAVAGEDRFSVDDVERLRVQLDDAMENQGPEKEVGVDNG
ncbi:MULTISPECIES: alpha/beta hydrolase [unclassified Corynebacterium]|uniref:alpha/beta hydrolase n=1 Tax=unclassified Corynebacterium TaxID=2624378 RepID=UPI0026487D99|nr:alpha/beta hydrolase [Corynebacterium sp.]MDN5581286.1 alpha/beta hydrolase [Corynebacterium sp.]